jgi:hypothetical protein
MDHGPDSRSLATVPSEIREFSLQTGPWQVNNEGKVRLSQGKTMKTSRSAVALILLILAGGMSGMV